jgi:hypothetical protein
MIWSKVSAEKKSLLIWYMQKKSLCGFGICRKKDSADLASAEKKSLRIWHLRICPKVCNAPFPDLPYLPELPELPEKGSKKMGTVGTCSKPI